MSVKKQSYLSRLSLLHSWKAENRSTPEIKVTQIEKGKAFIYEATVALKPEVTLGEYKGLEVPKADLEVTEEEIAGELRKEQEENSRVLDVDDRAVADGDKVTLDFEGFVDGEAFDGGKGTDYPLTIGSGSFIPGFEDQLVGAKAGDHVEVKVTFPEEYQAKDLMDYIEQGSNQPGESMWDVNIFGKTLEQLVGDGMQTKALKMTDESQQKLQDTMEKIINESNGGLVCIII
mgnify:CR=1 FL=1